MDLSISNNKRYAKRANLKGFKLAKFWLSVYYNYWLADKKLRESELKIFVIAISLKDVFGYFTALKATLLMTTLLERYVAAGRSALLYDSMSIKSIMNEYRF